MDFTGRHVFGSLTRISDVKFLSDEKRIREALERGVSLAKATPLSWQSHAFNPQGCTVIGLLAESHVSVHTYPEHSALFFDAFTCGEVCDPSIIFNELRASVGVCQYVFENFKRSGFPSQRISRGSSYDRTNGNPLFRWAAAHPQREIAAP